MRSANDAVISIDERGIVAMWNPAAAALFGYTEEEMLGEPLTAIIPTRFRDGHEAGLQRVSAVVSIT
jgi:PAS domain S-box-containing protein